MRLREKANENSTCWLDMVRQVVRIDLAQVTEPNTSIQTPTVDSSGIVAGILCIRWGFFTRSDMHTAKCKLVSRSPYSQSKYIQEKKTRDETHSDFEKRSWHMRCHYNAAGNVFIPPMSFKNCLSEAAKYKSIQIPGKGKSTYTKHFEAGVLVTEPLVLPMTKDTIESEWLHVPSDGRRGGTTRVEKCFPLIQEWSGVVEFLILDDIITEEVFLEHLNDAGSYIGIGRFRPRNNGFYGRFSCESIVWK